jgi:HAD superfamily hydrolase (TIGR01549 family)
LTNYWAFETDSGTTYIRHDSFSDLEHVDAVIFDCDGVLIDTKESYDQAVLFTAGRLSSVILGLDHSNLYSREDLYALRSTGGFNNDWDLTYALVSYTLSLNQTERMADLLREASGLGLGERIKYVGRRVTGNPSYIPPKIDALANQLDATGLKALDTFYKEKGMTAFIEALNEVLSYPGDVGESLITTMFEEVFCGGSLYREIFGREPVFVKLRTGLIEKEKIIVNPAMLEELSQYVDGRLGIASGSLKAQAEYILNPILDYFRPEACIWMDDVDEAKRETGRSDLHKPNPYSLLQAAAQLNAVMILYVGDTQADLMMAKNASRDLDVVFAGVYADSADPSQMKADFMQAGSDIITPSVNELTMILREDVS